MFFYYSATKDSGGIAGITKDYSTMSKLCHLLFKLFTIGLEFVF
ncbi:hypothetical protein [Treponema sp.]